MFIFNNDRIGRTTYKGGLPVIIKHKKHKWNTKIKFRYFVISGMGKILFVKWKMRSKIKNFKK